MKYVDSGLRKEIHSLAYWINEILKEDLLELRIQTGFFSSSSLGLFSSSLKKLREKNYLTSFLIGSNEADTIKDDVIALANEMGLPRNQAFLGIVSFKDAYFHPKTYHFKRSDGSEVAYIGSANLTSSGLALHVEAGIILDSREGDSLNHLQEIASAIDIWFREQREGITVISDMDKIEELAKNGIISCRRKQREIPHQNPILPAENEISSPRLKRLFILPKLIPNSFETEQITQPQHTSNQLSLPRNGFPPYLFFEPNATTETFGASALTGSLLPGNSSGLIVQLNKDSARHFMGTTGTANISIPVASISTFRFGVSGKHNRPACKFPLFLRYVSDEIQIIGKISETSISGYGFTEQETGHGDIRMLVPVSVRSLANDIQEQGKMLPGVGDIALLEWPTATEPNCKISFIDSQSEIYRQTIAIFNRAMRDGHQVGNGACWLSKEISPIWPT